MRPGRVLAIHRFYWPDTPPYAAMLRTIATHWADRGHRVDVLSSQPSYQVSGSPRPRRETMDGVRVRRLAMRPDAGPRARRLRNMLRFSGLVFLRVLLGPRHDVVMCSTAPQVLLGWATSWAARARGAAFVYHCMDLHPEIGRLSGEFAQPLVFRVLRRMDTATCRRASAVVVLSDDMRPALERRDPGLADRIVVLNNFDVPSFADPDQPSRGLAADPERLVVCFTGNLGRFQGLEDVVGAVLGDAPELGAVRLVLMGEGAATAGLRELVAGAPEDRRDRVVFLPHGSPAEARAVMRVSDLGLVSLVPEVIRYAYPSKTATYLSEGLPVLVAVEPDSGLADDVRRWRVGDVLPPGDVDAIRERLVAWSGRRDDLRRMRATALEVWRREFAVAGRLAAWDRLLDDVLTRRAA